MIKMTLIDAYDQEVQFRDLTFIDLEEGEIMEWDFENNLGAPNKIVVKFNPSFSYYEYVKTSETFGIRLETDTLNLAYVFFDRKQLERGVIKVELMSSIYKLQREPLSLFNNVSTDVSLASYLSSITSNVTFIPLGADTNINIVAGALTNYELMEEAIKYPFFFNWIEGGIDESTSYKKTIIYYGDFRNVENFYESDPVKYKALKPLTAFSFNDIDNEETDQAIITSYEVEENALKFNLVLAYVNTGGGAGEDNIITLDPTADYVNPQYPIVTVNGVYYVQVPTAPQYPQRVQVYPVSETGGVQDSAGSTTVSSTISAEVAYRKTVSYIQSFSASKTFNFDFALKKMTLAGVPIKVNFKETAVTLDGESVVLQEIQDTVIPSQWQGSGNEIFN